MREITPPTLETIQKIYDLGIDPREATRLSDEALDYEYGYGLSTDPESFGYKANANSSMFALAYILENLDRLNDLESFSSAVHDGWSYTVYHFDDPVYDTNPAKKESRLSLANQTYSALSNQEQEKDRVIARVVLQMVKDSL